MQVNKKRSVHSGRMRKDVHAPDTAKQELVSFIASNLPVWKDDPDRPTAEAETVLTSQLCRFLNEVARKSTAWSDIQFGVEGPDELNKGRKIDLSPALSGVCWIIEGRRHTCYDTIFPIECKRLPTPSGSDRDPREYVHTANSTTGGIQRFKGGFHGKAHRFGAMIAYVQEHSFAYWMKEINTWVRDLAKSEGPPWSADDQLQSSAQAEPSCICRLQSKHGRVNGLADIELHHLWIAMY